MNIRRLFSISKSAFTLFVIMLHAGDAKGQTNQALSLKELKAYEGSYEYRNASPFRIAANPRTNQLVAIINDTKFELQHVAGDNFISQAKERIDFFRSNTGAVAGYSLDGKQFKLLTRNVKFPLELWYPRLDSLAPYYYQQPKASTDGIPTGNLQGTGLDSALLGEMMRKIVNGNYQNVHSVLIMKDGKLVFEEYFYEYTKDRVHELRSATKTVVSALTGIAIDKGYIKSKDEKLLSFFPEQKVENLTEFKKAITIEDLLTNQSGLDCDITQPNAVGHEIKMNNSDDWVKFSLDLPVIDTPGKIGRYCSATMILAGRIVEKQTKLSLPQFAKETLFKDLGIKNFIWNFKPDRSSTETICEVYLTSRDMAKFGLVFLSGGKYKEKQVISAGWVDQSLAKHTTIQGVDYGYLWWLKYIDAGGKRFYGKAAQGNGGQKIFLWPELNMITVITGGNYNVQSPSDEIISKYILAAFVN